MARTQVSDRFESDVRGEDDERRSNQLLRAALRRRGARARAGHEPEHHDARARLDQAVGAKADKCDRAGHDARADRDGRFDEVPRETDPREHLRAPDEALAFGCCCATRHRKHLKTAHTGDATGLYAPAEAAVKTLGTVSNGPYWARTSDLRLV